MTLFELVSSPRHEVDPRLDPAIWPRSSYVDEMGRLCVGGVAATDLAASFGTPAYVVDEEDFRARIRNYRAALPGAEVMVGRHCEPGDEIASDVELSADIHPGDLLAVACTGAYHYSMGSSCSLVGRPPLVAAAGGRARELVRREALADLLARDRGWSGHSGDGQSRCVP
jgi:hypothetical protein